MNIAQAIADLEQIDALLAEGQSSWHKGSRGADIDLDALSTQRDKLQRFINNSRSRNSVKVGIYNPAFKN